jgi:hypothetical protein
MLAFVAQLSFLPLIPHREGFMVVSTFFLLPGFRFMILLAFFFFFSL